MGIFGMAGLVKDRYLVAELPRGRALGDVGGYGEAAAVLRGEAKDGGAGSVRMPVGVDDAERDYDTLGGGAGTDKKSTLDTGDDDDGENDGARRADYAEEQISDDASWQGCHGGECSRVRHAP